MVKAGEYLQRQKEIDEEKAFYQKNSDSSSGFAQIKSPQDLMEFFSCDEKYDEFIASMEENTRRISEGEHSGSQANTF